ncbi:signal transduction histidine kinase [Flavobacterium sp. HSC-32F16]|uniref:tetratricopeptide repeat-containing sensor histidine kinase n=1 Tax=Flavobacterium sp. HSC-32F16 TaxID=2910964 RepID=UPI0020A3919B|nr:ATP-binding protein [Flavobacterium sp. HSC-32F16]MCP2029378.1 signal transduction histidine kinase [Flavobacterium sp. HSC-32F16]
MILKNAHFYCLCVTILLLSGCQKKGPISVNYKNENGKTAHLIAKAQYLENNKKIDSAFYYYNEAKSICDTTDLESYLVAINSMAVIQQRQNDFVGSKNTLKDALPYLKQINNPKLVWETYNTLAINYSNNYQFKKALNYFNKALALNINELKNIEVEKNKAEVLIQENKYLEAIKILLSLTSKKQVIDTPKLHAEILDRIGYSYYALNNSEAHSFLIEALKIRTQLKDNLEIAKSGYNLALFYQYKNPSLAKKYIKDSYEKYKLEKNVDGKIASLKLIINYSNDNELKKHSIRYINLIDSIYQVRQKAKNQFAKIKYNSKKEKEENLILKTNKAENELKLEKQKKRNIIAYIIIIVSLCFFLVLYYYLTSKANREKIEAAYNSETRISKKLHDELANDIYHTIAFAENKNLSIAENKELLINNLHTIYSRTRDILNENSQITTNENYALHLKEMISEFKTPQINLILNGFDTISWEEVDRIKKIAVYRAIQELLVNMKKHSDASLVAIDFKVTNKNILINYTDNGKGIDAGKMVLKNGLHNIENRIHAIKGEFDIVSDLGKGFKTSIKFPL